MKTIIYLIIAIFLAAWTLNISARPGLINIGVSPSIPDPNAAFELRISGSWPTNCPPEFKQASIDGFIIDIYAESKTLGCDLTETQFSWKLDSSSFNNTSKSFTSGNYRAYFYVTQMGESVNVSLLQGFSLFTIADEDGDNYTPETGWWWAEQGGEFDTGGPGQGFMIEMQNKKLYISGNVYSDSGMPVWYMSAGTPQGNTFSGALNSVFGGQELFGNYQEPDDLDTIAEIAIEFNSPGTAILWLSAINEQSMSGELRIKPLSIVRMGFGWDPDFLLGKWILVRDKAPENETSNAYHLSLDTTSSPAIDQIQWQDSNSNASLLCDHDLNKPKSPPITCQINSANLPAIEFKQIAWKRLHGTDLDGDSWLLIRLE